MKVAVDTNVLVYAEGVDGEAFQTTALHILSAIESDNVLIPLQALAELHHVLLRKTRCTKDEAGRRASRWATSFETIGMTDETFMDAVSLSAVHQLHIFNAIILASASEAGCSLLLSQDMQHGFTWRGCTVVDPFAEPLHPALAALLQPS